MSMPTLTDLLSEYDRALAYTDALQSGLTSDQVLWRADDESSAIGWHLGHQAAVAHFMIRNLTAAEPSIDADLDALMDSATPERNRGTVPSPNRLREYRSIVAERVHFRVGQIDCGDVGAPGQLRVIAATLLVAIVNHEYQHDKWIAEVRSGAHGLDLPDHPTSALLTTIDDYLVVGAR